MTSFFYLILGKYNSEFKAKVTLKNAIRSPCMYLIFMLVLRKVNNYCKRECAIFSYQMFRNYVYKLYSFNHSVVVLLMLFYKILFIDRLVASGTTDR